MGTFLHSPIAEMGKPRRPVRDAGGGGVSVVVGAQESCVQGEGKQGVGTLQKPEERPVDSDHQADNAWLLNVQMKLYQWSREHPAESYRELWNWITSLQNLRCAWRRIASNKGRRTPGVDGKTTRLCQDSWKAGCITKGACPVREEGAGNRRWQHRTAPASYFHCS